jgi:CCR4-NOT transcription complex subunit 4
VIGLSPSISREETLKRYEYFGQYGKILSVTINKDNAFQSENQGTCFSAYLSYSHPKEASIAILAVDQFVFDGRLLRASFGRTKYCKFFLKESQCLNKDCPYQHIISSESDVLAQDEANKKSMFQQC